MDDLSSRRAEVIALADDVLCPHLQWPGHEDAPRPYNVSLGESLDQLPIAAAALGLIALAHGSLPIERAAALVRSPYIVGASAQWMARAAVERVWVERGQREIELHDVIATLADFDRPLAQRWRTARRESIAGSGIASCVDRRLANVAHRCGLAGRAPSSAPVPGARGLGRCAGAIRGAARDRIAVDPGRRIASVAFAMADTLFQPEVAHAPIQILGLLEAAGQPFDALWVTGLAAERGRPAQPNPLLPVSWQRERNVPHSSAARELAYAQALTAQLTRAAPAVVVSHAHTAEGHPRAASSLIDALPKLGADAIIAEVSTADAIMAAAPARERLADIAAPALVAGSRAPGGAGFDRKAKRLPISRDGELSPAR